MMIVAISLTACTSSDEHVAANKKGDIKCLSLNDIYSNDLHGFYVVNDDETLSPVMAAAEGYSGEAMETDPTRYVWWTNIDTKDSSIDYEKLIPVVTEDNPLVLTCKTTDDMPEEFNIEKYQNLGFTIGASVGLSETGESMFFITDETCSKSDFATKVEGNELGSTMEIAQINNLQTLPLQNVDTDINKLIGLDENKYYKFKLRIGTRTSSVDFKADTQVMKAEEFISLSIPYQQTDKQYFIISLPDNMEDGYYYINDAGMFKYESTK